MKVLTPIDNIQNKTLTSPAVFLAGTIDMGNSIDWQSVIISRLEKMPGTIFNPRRPDWDSSWEQKITNPEFKKQVDWELDMLAAADIIIMNFLPDSKSPITLLELGLFHDNDRIYVCCPDEFWRSGNIHIVCDRYSIPCFKTMDELLAHINYHGWSK